MTSIKLQPATYSAAMTTTLNSLADGSKVVSGVIDNSVGLYLFDDVEWHHEILSGTPTGNSVELYLICAQLDGVGYEDGDISTDPPSSALVGVFNIRAATTAQTHILRQIPLPPSKFKYLVINRTGRTLAASGNTLNRRPCRYST